MRVVTSKDGIIWYLEDELADENEAMKYHIYKYKLKKGDSFYVAKISGVSLINKRKVVVAENLVSIQKEVKHGIEDS